MSTPLELHARLAKAEAALVSLTRELAAIRGELARSSSAAASDQRSDAVVAAAQEKNITAAKTRIARDINANNPLDFERLLGRYGMLGIAVLAAIGAVGTFLSWAIIPLYLALGPEARVLIGLAFAALIGAGGLRLRRRERSFGSSLVGLALVIVLVCAYAAGPGFHLVPTWIAFVGSAAIAWGLAIFARGEDDEPLWCVAFGGASIAPFATSDNTGNLYGLMAYGLVWLLSTWWGVGHRKGPFAGPGFYVAFSASVR